MAQKRYSDEGYLTIWRQIEVEPLGGCGHGVSLGGDPRCALRQEVLNAK